MPTCVLGIDPGIASMGYGLVQEVNGELQAVDYGCLHTPSKQATDARLRSLYWDLISIIERYQPSEVAIELFIARNLRTALSVGQARGIAILAAANKDIPVYEYTPLEVKQRVCGYGRGDKKQIQEMVRIQLNLESVPESDDTADALAIAICRIGETRLSQLMRNSR